MTKSRKSAKSKSPPKAGAKAKPGASEAKPIKVRKGEKVVLLSGGQGGFLPRHVAAPGPSKSQDTRYVDIHEGELDEAQMATWVKQAAALPGWVP